MVTTDITGTMVQSYSICKRQAWLMAHQVIPEQEHPFLELGRLIDEQSYDREKKKIHFDNVVLDLIESNNGTMLIGEIKKSSKAEHSARLQLLFYLYKLKQKGIDAKGMLFFPEERRKINIELDEDAKKKMDSILTDISKLILEELPPKAEKINFCSKCAYKEFCWS